jgi:hypothetical protein
MDLRYKGFAVSVRGSSHIREKKVCQDCSAYYADDKMAIAIVCDGHGSNKHFRSDIGASKGVEVGLRAMKKFVTEYEGLSKVDEKENLKKLDKLKNYIIFEWDSLVVEHFDKNPLSNQEIPNLSSSAREKLLSGEVIGDIQVMYGTTFIAMVMTEDYWLVLQLGDGDVVTLADSKMEMPVPDDERLRFNMTTSMCNRDAISNFRISYGFEPVVGMIASSDGVSNSFNSKANFLKFSNMFMEDFYERSGNEAYDELKGYLPKLSADGSGDDISIAAVWNVENLKSFFSGS